MSDLSFSQQERLKQMERELEQASLNQGSPAQEPAASWLGRWGRLLLTLLAILGCILLVGFLLRIFTTILKLAVVVGLGYLLYVFVVAPWLGLRSRPQSDAGDSKADSLF